MTKHQRETHRTQVEGCFGCRISSVAFNTSHQAATKDASEKALRKDLDAYKRLRDDGLQPVSTKGAADIERHAKTRFDVETGGVHKGITDDHVRQAAEITA